MSSTVRVLLNPLLGGLGVYTFFKGSSQKVNVIEFQPAYNKVTVQRAGLNVSSNDKMYKFRWIGLVQIFFVGWLGFMAYQPLQVI